MWLLIHTETHGVSGLWIHSSFFNRSIMWTHQVLGWTPHLPPSVRVVPSQPWRTSVAGGHSGMSLYSHHTWSDETTTVHQLSPSILSMQYCRENCGKVLRIVLTLGQVLTFVPSSEKGHTSQKVHVCAHWHYICTVQQFSPGIGV